MKTHHIFLLIMVVITTIAIGSTMPTGKGNVKNLAFLRTLRENEGVVEKATGLHFGSAINGDQNRKTIRNLRRLKYGNVEILDLVKGMQGPILESVQQKQENLMVNPTMNKHVKKRRSKREKTDRAPTSGNFALRWDHTYYPTRTMGMIDIGGSYESPKGKYYTVYKWPQRIIGPTQHMNWKGACALRPDWCP